MVDLIRLLRDLSHVNGLASVVTALIENNMDPRDIVVVRESAGNLFTLYERSSGKKVGEVVVYSPREIKYNLIANPIQYK